MAAVKFESLIPIVIAVITTITLLAAGLLITDSILKQSMETSTATVNNLTFDLTPAVFTIPEASDTYFNSMDTNVRVINGSAGTYFLVASGNYTATSAGTIVAAAGYTANYSDANITYTYSYEKASTVSSDINASITGLGDIGADWIGIIIIVVIASILVGLIITLMARKRT